jgi:hypothetical protein
MAFFSIEKLAQVIACVSDADKLKQILTASTMAELEQAIPAFNPPASEAAVFESGLLRSPSKRVRADCLETFSLLDLNPQETMDWMHKAALKAKAVSLVSSDAMLASDAPVERNKELPKEITDMIGIKGELFAFELLKQWFGAGVSAFNWVSSSRLIFFPQDMRNVDDSLGYDFFVEDRQGTLNGQRLTWLIEVKSHQSSAASQFRISSNEWNQAQHAAASRTHRYVIMGISLEPMPSLLYWIEDPYSQYCQGKLQVLPKDFMVSRFCKLARGS